MPHHPSFFDSPSASYSFKEYLSCIKSSGYTLNEEDLPRYIQWYKADLNWAKEKNICPHYGRKITKAFIASKALTMKTAKLTFTDVAAEKSNDTIINKYFLRSGRDSVIGNVYYASLPQEQHEHEQEEHEQQHEQHAYGNKKRRVQRVNSKNSDNGTDSSYHGLSDSDSDQSEYPESKFDYLVGPGVLTVSAEEFNNPLFSAWILDGSNISSIFMNYRCGVIKKAEQQQHLTITERLALNFFFLVNIDKSKPAFLSRKEWNNITLSMIKMKPIMEISESTRTFLQKFARAARTSASLALDTLDDFSVGEEPETKKFIRTLLTNLAQKYDGLLLDDMNEDTFVKSRVDPIMAAFFKNEDDIIIDGCSTTLASSETSRKLFDPSLRGKMADITVSLKEENGIKNLIIMEVKPPAKAKDDVDLLKMASMMKNSIDCMHAEGQTSIGLYVMGVIVEGYRCDLYMMDLDNTFLYRLFKLGTFYIPVDRYDFGRLPDLIEHMVTLRKCFDDMVHKYQDDVITQLRMIRSTPPQQMKKTIPSFMSPVRIP